MCHFLCYTADHICANFGINTCFIYANIFISFSQTATKCHICRNYNKIRSLEIVVTPFLQRCLSLQLLTQDRLRIDERLAWQVPTQNYIYFTDTFLVAKDSQFLAYIPFFFLQFISLKLICHSSYAIFICTFCSLKGAAMKV